MNRDTLSTGDDQARTVPCSPNTPTQNAGPESTGRAKRPRHRQYVHVDLSCKLGYDGEHNPKRSRHKHEDDKKTE